MFTMVTLANKKDIRDKFLYYSGHIGLINWRVLDNPILDISDEKTGEIIKSIEFKDIESFSVLVK